MRVVPYNPKYKNDFIDMNKAWISEMFVMEPEDERELGNIEPYVENGGQIFSLWMKMRKFWLAA